MRLFSLYSFASRCFTLDDFPERLPEIKTKLVSGEIPPDDLVYFCDNHLALTAVYSCLKRNHLLGSFSPDLTYLLEDMLLNNRNRNMKIVEQARQICEALNQKNIEPVFLKGTAFLLCNLYPDLGDRLMGDIDFLVQPGDYFKAAEILMQMGYMNPWKTYGDLKLLKHYPRLYKCDQPADVEIHQSPVNFKYAQRFDSKLLFEDKVTVPGLSNCFVPSYDHQMIHNFIHSQLSNSGYRFKQTSLRDIYDFYLLSKKVTPGELLNKIEERHKANAYFSFASMMLNIKTTKLQPGIRIGIYQFVSRQFFKYPLVGNFYKFILKTLDLIMRRYMMRLISGLWTKESRSYIFNRINDPAWFKQHFLGLISYYELK